MSGDPADRSWSRELRRLREERGMTREVLARRSGISVSAVKAFETGKRHPKEGTLSALIDALGLTREQANPVRSGAGYPDDWYSLLHDRYPSAAIDLEAAVKDVPWPAFVSNQAIDILHTNQMFEDLMGVDLRQEFTARGDRNFLAHASNPRFTGRFDNFDELVTYMVGLVKGDPRWHQSPDRPAPWLNEPLARFMAGDPGLVSRVLQLWNEAPPIPHRARHTYRVRIRHGDAVLGFAASTTIADLWNELSWNEWIPDDDAAVNFAKQFR
jgi:transcriptional regulator with XRE-family HTH domain